MADLRNFPDTISWERVQSFDTTTALEKAKITSQIVENSTSRKAQVEFLTMLLSQWDGSVRLQKMHVGERYYRNENDIIHAKRYVIGRSYDTDRPAMIEADFLANNRVPHPFLKKLTRQKLGYLLGSPIIIQANKDDVLADRFVERCKEYMGKNFHKLIKNVARDSIVKSIGWVQVYYDEKGELKFRRCEPENSIPLWKDSDHTILDAFIYRYAVEVYDAGEKRIDIYVDYYTEEGVYHYKIDDDGRLTINGDIAGPDPYFNVRMPIIQNGQFMGWNMVPMNWGKLPFIPFKYDPDEQGLLDRVKAMIDDYDKRRSQLSNNIEDTPNALTVVKDYDGEDKQEFVHNKNVLRTAFVTGTGDVSAIQTPIDIAAEETYLEKTKNNIYEFGAGVNTSNKDIRDTSGVALKYLYADLDTDCKDWGGELEWSIMELLWFVQQDILARYGENYTAVQYSIGFKIDVIINTTELITNAFTSTGVISQRTIVENHPWVTDVEKELADLRGELEEQLDLKEQYGQSPANPAETKLETMGQA